jgi:hypothetical protein
MVPPASTEFEGRIEPAVAAIFIGDRDNADGNATLPAATYELTFAEAMAVSALRATLLHQNFD